ncbi:MAG: hypothetical protein K5Q68_14950 [Roseococcus sp.]|nr:hypothetical protein [Roseococcus sp.]
MVAYSFQKRFIGQVLAGLEPGPWLPGMKRHTLRAPREGRSQHARPEQPVHLYTAMRTKQCRQLGRSVCRLQMPVRLVWDGASLGIARNEGAAPRSRVGDLAPVVQHLLSNPPLVCFSGEFMERFARTDGFQDAAEMTAFFEPPAGQEAVALEMVLIAWSPEVAE